MKGRTYNYVSVKVETQCVYLSANCFSMAWEKGIQVPYPFFVFVWHWRTNLNFAFCFSFSPNFEKRFWTSYFVFRFRITLKNGYRFQFSLFVFASLWKTDMNFVFVFRFRITLKNGFEFRFSFSHHFEKQIWISFVVQSFEAPLTGAFTFYVTESKWIFSSAGPKWVVNYPPPSPQWYFLNTHGTPFFNNGWQMIWW